MADENPQHGQIPTTVQQFEGQHRASRSTSRREAEELREKEKREKEVRCREQLRQDRQERKENYLNSRPKVGHERRRAILAKGMNGDLHTEEEEWEYGNMTS